MPCNTDNNTNKKSCRNDTNIDIQTKIVNQNQQRNINVVHTVQINTRNAHGSRIYL